MAVIVDICGDYLKLRADGHKFYYPVQFSSRGKTVFVPIQSVPFEDVEDDKQIQEDASPK